VICEFLVELARRCTWKVKGRDEGILSLQVESENLLVKKREWPCRE
jgi:hypothetical protein